MIYDLVIKNGTLNIDTWNIKDLHTKQEEVVDEIRRLKMDVVTITETKKKGKRSEQIQGYIQIYSGVDKACRAKAGVSIFIRKALVKI